MRIMSKNFAPIVTEKFTIRQFRAEDAGDIVRNISSDKIYAGTYRIPRPYTLEIANQYIAERLESYAADNPKSMLFVIEVDGEVVGDVGFKYVLGHKGEIVYWLADKHHGKGVVSTAAKLICDYGFDMLGLDKIYAEIYIDNIGSQKVVEKLGFHKEGEMKKHLVKNGEFKDIYYFAKFK